MKQHTDYWDRLVLDRDGFVAGTQTSQGQCFLFFLFLQTRMDTLNTYTHVRHTPYIAWVFEQWVLALANRSVHSSSCSPVPFPLQVLSLSTGVIPFHLSSCIFNPLLSILCLFLYSSVSVLSLELFIVSSHLSLNLILSASSLNWSIPLNTLLESLPLPPSIHPPLTLLLLSLRRTNTPQVGLLPPSISSSFSP